MAFQTHYRPEPGFFETTITESVNADDVIAIDVEILGSPHWDGGKPRLVLVDHNVDLSEIDMASLAEEILPHLEAARARRTRKERIAWVVPNDRNRPIVAVWELMPDKDSLQDFKSFSNQPEAMSWLLAADD